jgi:hypothetical protein
MGNVNRVAGFAFGPVFRPSVRPACLEAATSPRRVALAAGLFGFVLGVGGGVLLGAREYAELEAKNEELARAVRGLTGELFDRQERSVPPLE